MKYIFGENALNECIKNNIHINKVYLCEQKTKLISYLNENNIKYEIVNKSWFLKFNKELNHQFIVSEIEINNIYSNINDFLHSNKYKSKSTHFILMLDSIEDPRNFGSIIRTAYALGVDAIIYKKNNQVDVNDLVIKTSMGACYLIDLICIPNLSQALEILKQNNFWSYATNLNTTAKNYNELDYKDDNICLIVGNEQKGISQLLSKNADFNIYIKMHNNFNSLNVSVATGILVNHIICNKNK